MTGVPKDKIKINAYLDKVEVTTEDEKKYHEVVDIPPEADIETVKSSYNNGILEIVFKKKEKRASYSMVISDIRMSAMNGLELVTQIRQKDYRIKVLLITGFDQNYQNDREFFIMKKPIKIAELIEIVNCF